MTIAEGFIRYLSTRDERAENVIADLMGEREQVEFKRAAKTLGSEDALYASAIAGHVRRKVREGGTLTLTDAQRLHAAETVSGVRTPYGERAEELLRQSGLR